MSMTALQPNGLHPIQTELFDAYGIQLSDTAITQFTHRYYPGK
jgi:hypothetical protein